ncbi:RsmB/NOP family class I SAM-dependent RNA methyltransferase [Neolewinella litorea]|uniref:RsmB/NOP family class I SAM-dependent RNA methyltransferase n=1 Tax=Neolewinella litorea TaxID=2562452 RepID=A0A4S4NNV2_9BACT|nr:RsmB/NOP family class I SAM-dependent RNA methyltransferase [Neolewinella litorea]THH40048.1 RsmB/NOP family class I SAM-dependent RNA methyltransferase [Neolewinella litorea]
MKLYAAHLHAIAEALQNIFREGAYADREIARILKADKRRGSNDRAFIAEHTYAIVRYYRLYAHLAGAEPQTKAEWWRLMGIHLLLNGIDLPDWREFKDLDRSTLQSALEEARTDRALRESIPDWLDVLGEEQLGAEWTATIAALNEQAPVVLRVNRLQADAAAVTESLAQEGIVVEPLAGDALLVTERKNLFRTKAFQRGLFEVQDYSSQQAAPALEVEPGQLVVDACAGAGGKSLHLAALMENKGRLLSLDIHGWKLEELKRRARRNGVTNLEARPITSTKIIKRLTGKADRVLLDVPCSGLGVLRRNPDAKWKLSPESIERVVQEQQEILTNYSRMVKPGGKLVYATCSVLPRENGDQLRAFLPSPAGEGWEVEEERSLLPQRDGYDGFFISRLSRTR